MDSSSDWRKAFKTASTIGGGFKRLLGRKVDQDLLDELEATLITADCGLEATERIVGKVKEAYANREVTGEILDFVKAEMKKMLDQGDNRLKFVEHGPTVIMVCGVNGSGKTTSIAKLTTWLTKQGKKVLLGAGDTFRAAAVDQLSMWAERVGADIVRANPARIPPRSHSMPALPARRETSTLSLSTRQADCTRRET